MTLSNNMIDLNLSSSNTDWLKLSQLVNGFEQLSEFDLYDIPFDLNKIIFEYILEQSYHSNAFVQESLTCVDAKRKLLNLTLNLNYLSLKKSKQSESLVNDFLIEVLDKYLFTSNDNNKKILIT